MRCCECPYRQRSKFRMGDRAWVYFQGDYYPAIVDVTQGPATEFVDLYLSAEFTTRSGAVLRTLIPQDGGPWVLPFEPPPQTCATPPVYEAPVADEPPPPAPASE